MGGEASLAELAIGSHCEVSVSGRRSSRQQGRKGTVVEFQTRSAVQVVFDGFKSRQTLHPD
jgi:hypothetical protein